jgi:hypothetical protein
MTPNLESLVKPSFRVFMKTKMKIFLMWHLDRPKYSWDKITTRISVMMIPMNALQSSSVLHMSSIKMNNVKQFQHSSQRKDGIHNYFLTQLFLDFMTFLAKIFIQWKA